MALIKYWHPTDDTVTNVSLGVGEDEGWWPGVQRLTNIAIATALVAASFASALAQSTANKQQDDPAGSLHGQYDEDFWQNPVAPVQATFTPAYIPDPEYLPAGFLHGQYDEDFWQNQVAPAQATLSAIYLPDPEHIIVPVAVTFQPDEDFWINPVQPISAYPVPLVFITSDDTPFFQPDEDLWSVPLPPVTWNRVMLAQWAFDDQFAPRTPRFVPWIQEDDA